MNEQMPMPKNSELTEVNFKRLFDAVIHKIWLIMIVAVLCVCLVVLVTWLWITPQYEASAVFYVNNSALSIGDASLSIESGDITASKSLVNTYIVILKDRVTLVDILDYAGVDMHYSELEDLIKAEPLNETEVFKVTVTNSNPQDAASLANAVAYILPKRIASIIDGSSAKIVSDAVTPVKPSSPNYTMNAIIGFLLGFVISAGAIILRVMLDTTVRLAEDIGQSCRHPILVSVPDMTVQGKAGSSYYGYGKSQSRSKKGKYATTKQASKHAVFGPDISFAASEAYKLLRTKLQFSFSDENNCRVIGLSSALSGEGKSLTAVNLAFALSQLNKRVLLVDCDMRRPTVAEKLSILKEPGLSSYLTRQCHLDDLIQMCGIKNNESAFHVITAGQNPPNPIELLSSERMKKALGAMREAYDYVILDLPPVGEVSDAMAVAKETDGMLLIVRQNVCDRVILTESVQQFEFINAKILGVVFNCVSEHGGNYGNGYYKSYYKRYGKKYAYGERSGSNADGNK